MRSPTCPRRIPQLLSFALNTRAASSASMCVAPSCRPPASAASRGIASLATLRRQLDTRDGSLLPCTLPYHLPASKNRALPSLAHDLIVLEYFSPDRIFPSYTTGWLLDTPSKRPILITCCHTLHETLSNAPDDKSGIRLYRHYPNKQIGHVEEVLSAWTASDLLFLSPRFTCEQDDLPKPFTANPYPPPVGDALSFFQTAENITVDTTLCLYTNPGGREVSPGSYAHLHAMDVAHLPAGGSSGGPLIDERGRVCGVMRGRTFAYGQKRPYGFATPAERIWEVFKLF